MITIHASQLIFTRVEPPYSSQNKAGFQTVYQSPALSAGDISALEKRIQCFQPPNPALVRRQFFTLTNGRIVVTHTIQIEADPEITDRSRRSGVFISHCLILDLPEFEKVANNPFPLFDHYPFITNAAAMVKKFGQGTGMAPVVDIEIPEPQKTTVCSWKGEEMRKLVYLALQAEQWDKEGKWLFISGPETDLDETLRTIFYLLPKHKRLFCSFDTCIDGNALPAGSYWAVSGTRLPGGNATVHVDTTARRLMTTIQEKGEAQDIYWKWLQSISSRENFQFAIQPAPAIQMLCTAFMEKNKLNPDILTQEGCQEFMNLYSDLIAEHLKIALNKLLERQMAELILAYIYQTVQAPVLLNFAARQEIDSETLGTLITEYILIHKPDLDERNWKALQGIAQQNHQMMLLYISVTLRKKIDEKMRDQALESMNEVDFSRILAFVMAPLEPANFVSLRNIHVLIRNPILQNMTDEQFLNLIERVVEVGAANYLDYLIEYLSKVTRKSLSGFEKFAKKHSEKIPEKFKARIISRSEELKPSGFSSGFLKR
ncbi:MAG TPA: hypothetical protein VHY08_17855 [Bacillota bacterium]|nr:hypothetical protein [Bacillota bacterium]